MMCRAGTYTCAITNQDTVVCWGKSDETLLGVGRVDAVGDQRGELADDLHPVYLGKPQPIVRSIACNVNTICAVVNDGDVKCIGKIGYDSTNAANGKIIKWFGQLGRNVPYVALGTASDGSRLKAESLSCGTNVCCVVLNDGGSVKCWGGGNALGVSGARPASDTVINLSVDGNPDPIMGDDMPRVPLGNNSLGIDHNATKVRCGDDVCCAILDDGSVKCWGSLLANHILGTGDGLGRGENNTAISPLQDFPSHWLGMGDDLPAVDLGTDRTAKEIAFGRTYACAVLDDGSVKCWGQGPGHLFGAEGGDETSDMTFGGAASYTLDPVLLGAGRKAVDIAAASSAMCVVFNDGDVKCWGFGYDGILGVGDSTHRGGNQNDMGDNLPRVDLGRQRRAFRLAKGSGDTCGHMCAMLSSEDCPICGDEVTCWGLNDFGQLGVGDTRNRGDARDPFPNTGDVVDFGADIRVRPKQTTPDSFRAATAPPSGHVVSRAFQSTCVIVDNGGVKCFGASNQLCIARLDDANMGDAVDELGDALLYAHITSAEDVVALVAMTETHCALLEGGDVHCWGKLAEGETGTGESVSSGYVYCDAHTQTSKVNLGSGARVKSMCGGQNHACALLRDGRVKCWGKNVNGKLGIVTNVPSIVGHDAAYMGDNLPAVNLGTNVAVASLACGSEQTCATFEDGSVKCWGSDFNQVSHYQPYNIPEFGSGVTQVRVKEVFMGRDHACALTNAGAVMCWGSNINAQLGQGDEVVHDTPVEVDLDGTVTSLAMTKTATCALMSDESVKCWGKSSEGALGYNDTTFLVGNSADQMGVHLPSVYLGTDAAGNPRRVKALSAGGSFSTHMCAVLKAETDCADCFDEVKCWGANANGQLGIGNTEYAGSLADSMGDNLPSVDLGAGLGPGSLA